MNTRTEPAVLVGLVASVVSAVLALLVGVGINVSPDVEKAILGVVSAVGPFVASLVIRGKVFSPATVSRLTLGRGVSSDPVS